MHQLMGETKYIVNIFIEIIKLMIIITMISNILHIHSLAYSLRIM